MSQEIIPQLENALEQTISLLGSLSEEQLNTIPFKGSWTAAQVGRHIYKSLDGTGQMLQSPMPVPERNPLERAPEYKNILLDFDRKMESPDFLIPEETAYDRKQLVASIKEVKEEVLPVAEKASLNEEAPLTDGNPLKGSTKLEILHFLAYHTIRHNRQIEKIREALA
jgi:hypothetical protein